MGKGKGKGKEKGKGKGRGRGRERKGEETRARAKDRDRDRDRDGDGDGDDARLSRNVNELGQSLSRREIFTRSQLAAIIGFIDSSIHRYHMVSWDFT